MQRVKAKILRKAKVPIQKIPKATRLSMKTVERLQKRRGVKGRMDLDENQFSDEVKRLVSEV